MGISGDSEVHERSCIHTGSHQTRARNQRHSAFSKEVVYTQDSEKEGDRQLLP